ncbi:aquaporin TIP2-3-like [Iris pallida]|uniref:Aquaporin TIP2-3-like n=1 Tax=Iris pallida TaxID=29817 RepID=A0AAX6DHM1_IRIPA|nr:aquaporin TIP2-3-like [Iris pallida]
MHSRSSSACRWPPTSPGASQPCGHLGPGRGRQHHHPHRRLLLDCPAPRLHRRLSPAQVRHRRLGGPNPRSRVGHDGAAGSGDGDRDHLRPGVHRVRDRRGPEEGLARHHRAHRDRVHRGRQHPRGRPLQRRLDEPRPVLRSRGGRRGLLRELGVLGWAAHRGRAGRAGLWGYLHWVL